MNKKGVSVMIAYALLIIIAIALSVGVYTSLKILVPDEKLECPQGVSLIIKDISCLPGDKVEVTFENKGRFDVDGAYVRIANEQDGEPVWEIQADESDVIVRDPGFFYFIGPNGLRVSSDSQEVRFDYSEVYSQGEAPRTNSQMYEILIEPIVRDRETNEIALCNEAVVSRRKTCPDGA